MIVYMYTRGSFTKYICFKVSFISFSFTKVIYAQIYVLIVNDYFFISVPSRHHLEFVPSLRYQVLNNVFAC